MSAGPVTVNARPASRGTDVKVGSFVSHRPHVLRSLDRALLMTPVRLSSYYLHRYANLF